MQNPTPENRQPNEDQSPKPSAEVRNVQGVLAIGARVQPAIRCSRPSVGRWLAAAPFAVPFVVLWLMAGSSRAAQGASISTAANQDGRLEVWYVDVGGVLRSCSQSSASVWPTPQIMASNIQAVALARNSDGRLEVFYSSTNQTLYRRKQATANGSWSAETVMTGRGIVLAIGENADGRLEAFVAEGGNTLAHMWQVSPSGEWSTRQFFAPLGGAVALGRNADGRMEIFYVQSGGYLCHRWQVAPSSYWGGEAVFYSGVCKTVAVGRNADGRQEVVYTGADDALHHRWQVAPSGGWATEARLNGSAKELAMGQNADGRLELFCIGTNQVLHHFWQTAPNSGWAGPAQFGWDATNLAVGRNTNGCLEALYLGLDGVFYHDWQTAPSGGWSGEYPLPGPTSNSVAVGTFNRICQYDPQDGRTWHINDHCFALGPDGIWHMFGILAPDPDQSPVAIDSFGHATATNLAQGAWTWQPPPFIEPPGPDGVLWAPHIVAQAGRFHMFYCSGGAATNYAISLRTSTNLWQWDASPQVLFRDGFQGRDPMVMWEPSVGLWVLYYCATEAAAGGNYVVAYRTSADLVHWSERRIAYRDFHQGQAYGPTESPFVVRRGEYWYLFLGPRPYDHPSEALPNWQHLGYVGTDVFRSRRWDAWSNADYVGHLPAHAPELVCSEQGDWHISHSGVKQGGLYLAPLGWLDGSAPSMPRFRPLRRVGSSMLVELEADAGSRLIIESSTDLLGWQPFVTRASQWGLVDLSLPIESAQRFFRARLGATRN